MTIIIFVGGLINSIFSFLTFKSEGLRQVGCGMYLLASSITSLLTISMLVIKFWFVVLTQIDVSTSLSVLRGGCVFIEPVLKLFVYFDGWLNACVAVERAINVSKGVRFDKKNSKRIARWIIIVLPFCIMSTLIHELLYRKVFEYQTEINNEYGNEHGNETNKTLTNINAIGENETYVNRTNEGMTELHVWCVTRYSPSVQDYNTAILFVHLVAPFIANLFSALFIIFGAARQRSVVRTNQSYREHICEQLSEHKQLIISPMILLLLSVPRLIIALLPGCVRTSEYLWLYLGAYFISFTPSMLIFVIFVLPSNMYMKTFKESFHSRRRVTRQ
jgi:hypothetical protein